MKQLRTPTVLLGLMALCAMAGCSLGPRGDGWRFTKSLDIRRVVGLKKDELAPPQTPTRLVSTWQDTVLNRVGAKSQRGFGGRLLFFNEESEDPIRVEGQLVVYAYDDDGRAAYETQPTRRFVFPAEQFARHESDCKLGASYSVWLPWDEVGGEQKNISLIARFEPKAGPLLVGDQTRHLLPGMRRLATGEVAPPTKPVSNIRLAEYSQASAIQPPLTKDARPEVTSIALSGKSWEQRLRAAQNAPSKPAPSKTDTNTTSRERATELPGSARQ